MSGLSPLLFTRFGFDGQRRLFGVRRLQRYDTVGTHRERNLNLVGNSALDVLIRSLYSRSNVK
jgi:hypothetical protein